ncbi:MerR family transcriptional regulator [Aureimonas leprariae]|uniref:MerR family DNA-binding transcriptional regulator n=1 Tax=Plantimonas leprariae TaxID=2615207 RepID=A0A7V7PKP8_9HYPH|nr:MerR family DNA-binding transcriptional regulator [Aureimonas leprariae]KAB0676558.1 MerR family DNA-binding transcriptional regulator [Aureimonas leprariae]
MPNAKVAYLEEAENEGGSQPAVEYLLGIETVDGDGKDVYRIGDLAKEFGVTLRTLRFYEDRGLLSPQRRGTTRLYSRRDRKRLRLVLLGKALGFSLTEARQMIDIYSQPNGKRRQVEVALERFAQQREVLLGQRREVDRSLEAMDLSIDFLRKYLPSV